MLKYCTGLNFFSGLILSYRAQMKMLVILSRLITSYIVKFYQNSS